MARIELTALDTLDINIDRTEDERGSIILTITADGEDVRILCGGFYDDAVGVAQRLASAAWDAEQLTKDWQDRPDVYDGYVTFDRGQWYVTLEGKHIGNYPSEDIATYELARAMAEAGCYPNTWIVRHQSEDLLDTLPYFNEGGTAVKPLPGVEYEEGERVSAEGLSAYVVKDYGNLGITYVLSGDDEVRFTEDRSEVVPVDDGRGED